MERLSLLCIEDELETPIDTDPFITILMEHGYTITTAESGERAWELLEETAFDGIILDIMLPHEGLHIDSSVPRYQTGIILLSALRKGRFPKNLNTPVIVLSAIADSDDVNRIKEEFHPTVYIEKPIRPPEFLAKVRIALHMNGKAES